MAECSVYVMGQPDGPKKVGTAHKVAARRNFVQCGAPFNVAVLATQTMPNEQHAFALEQMCHIDLDEHWVFGEWFNAPLPLVKGTIERNLARLQPALAGFDDAETAKDALWIHVRNALGLVKKDIIRERTRAGLAAAKARGRVGGRTAKRSHAEVLATKNMGTAAATKRLGFATKAGYLRRLAAAEKWQSEQPKETADAEG